MAIDALTLPGTVVLARNQVIAKTRSGPSTGEVYVGQGAYAEMEYDETDRVANLGSISVEITEPDGTSETVQFIAKAVYDDDYEIPNAAFAGTDTEYWVAVATIMAAHSRMAPFVTVERILVSGSTYRMRVQLRSAETGWEVALTNTEGFTVTDTAAVADSTPDNYSALVDVFVERTYLGADWAKVASLRGTPESDTGFCYFDLGPVLAAEIRANRQEPLVLPWGTAAPELADTLRRWYLRYTEEYGAPVVVQDWAYPGTLRQAIDGGVSQAIFAATDFFATLDDDNALLTWMPDGRRIGLDHQEYLAWYNHTGADAEVYITMVWYKVTDGTQGGTTDFYTGSPITALEGEVVLFPVNPTMMGLDAEATAYKYTVQVWTTVGITPSAVSQERTYFIDREYYESERYIQYLNGFGVPECWRCTGEWSKRLRVERSTTIKPLVPGYNELGSDRYQYARTWDNELTYRTGYLTEAEADVLQELLIAGEVYDVSADGYIPLLITSNEFSVYDTRGVLRSYQFTAVPRLDFKNYSKTQVATAAADAWEEPDGSYWFTAMLTPWEA